MKLNAQVVELQNKAIEIIKEKLTASNGSIVIADTNEVMDKEFTDDISEDFKAKTVMFAQEFERASYDDYFLLSITGNDIESELSLITEYGNIYTVGLFELDVFNITSLADYLTEKY